MRFDIRLLVLSLITLAVCATSNVRAEDEAKDDNRLVYETEIAADVDDVWTAFTTNDGLRSWMAPIVDIDLAVGGKMRSNYSPNGVLGDETTIENTILAYDPGRMLSLKATKYPKGFPFAEAAKGTWSVFYFAETAPGRTRITVVGLGYGDDEQSKVMRSFFAKANEQSLAKLEAVLKQAEDAEEE